MDDCNDCSSTKLQYVRCLKCNKIICCPRHDTSKLIEHIRCDHPEVCVVESNTSCQPPVRPPCNEVPSQCVSSCCKPQKGPDCTPRSDKTKADNCHLFRTSIERWRPANGSIFCPFCGCQKAPLVKMRNERMSGDSTTAACLLACWPFCFLPFLVPGNEKEYLYCSNCHSFLGLYDRSNNCIRPNRQFSERMSKRCAQPC